jgi:signal transduction histidine kinase/ligand-binding sensor domain-containing protein
LILQSAGIAANSPRSTADPPLYIRAEWDVSRGYPGGRIYGITQTTDGYLWIGTDRGLIRFDGSAFHVFRQATPGHTPIDSVFALAGDKNGNLLISTPALQRLRLRNEELEELPRLPDQPVDPLAAIYQEQNGSILIATVRRGFLTYDGDSFRTLKGTRSDMTAAVHAHDGTLWVGTATYGLFSYPNGQLEKQSAEFQHVKINALLPKGEHGLWIGTDKGLLRWQTTESPGPASGPAQIQTMIEDRQNNIWIGSAQGLYRIGHDEAAAISSAHAYSPDLVIALFEDREGDIWAGTSTGILQLRQRILTTYPFGGSAEGGGGPILTDQAGSVWCAPPHLGLVRALNGKTERIVPGGDFSSIAGDSRELWLGQKNGALLRLRTAGSAANVSTLNIGLPRKPILSIFKSDGGNGWLGLQDAGAAEIVNGRTVMHTSAECPLLNSVTAIEQTPDGVMWFGTSSGIASFSGNRWKSYGAQDGLPPGRIHFLLADATGTVWAGADQGLAFIQNGGAHVAASSLPSLQEPVFGIAIDRDDYLWVVTSSHILRVKRTELLGGDPKFARVFGSDDGLPAIMPSRTSRPIASDADGRIWISLGNALVMADPFALRQPSAPTLVQFQHISADEVSLPVAAKVTVPAGHLRTVIRFTGLNLAAPNRVHFRYRLNGLDHAWGEATSVPEANYTNLGPGPYRFEVQASNIDGLWNGSPAAVDLYVEPSFWQTLWFRYSAAVAICAIGVIAYQLKLRAVKRQWTLRFQERLDERTRIARELHDTLLQSFHGLILRFQAVRDMLPDEPAAAGDALSSAIDRAAEAITEGRDAVQALRGEQEEYDDLGESLAAIDREFRIETRGAHQQDAHASYRVLVEGTPRRLHPVVRDDLYRIAREAVRNAFHHAGAQQIELDIRYEDAELRLRVRDDGKGIDPHVLSSGRRSGHYGLPGMRERATSIGGQFEIWSELRRGTEIEITIPGMIAYVRFGDSSNARVY